MLNGIDWRRLLDYSLHVSFQRKIKGSLLSCDTSEASGGGLGTWVIPTEGLRLRNREEPCRACFGFGSLNNIRRIYSLTLSNGSYSMSILHNISRIGVLFC